MLDQAAAVNLTAPQLMAVMPHLPTDRAALWLPHLTAAMAEFSIDTPARAAAFLAQAAHESGELARLVENLMYSAAGLRRTWPTRFPDDATAARFARQPAAIANHVYGGRMGNGPEASGDGWRYRGRGIFQLTGRMSYARAGGALGLPIEDSPEMLEQPGPACRSAGWFWRSRNLSILADGDNYLSFEAVTRAINGGLSGLAERRAYWERAKAALYPPA